MILKRLQESLILVFLNEFYNFSVRIVEKSASQMGRNLILYGITKLFLRTEANIFLENALIEKVINKFSIFLHF